MTAPTPDQRFYDRRASIFVGRSGARSTDGLASGTRFDGPSLVAGQITPGFRISFEVEQNIKSKTNKASAKIYGLLESSRASFTNFVRAAFQIEAGYATGAGLLFDGEATHVASANSNGGFETTITAHDGLQASRGIVNASLGPNSSMGQAIKQIATSMGVSATRALAKAASGDFNGAVGTFYNGLNLSGPADKAMDRLADSAGFDWAIVNGELVIVKPGQTFDEDVVILGPSSGLIGSPERRYEDKRPKDTLVGVTCLLNPRMTIARRFRIESHEFRGDFRVESVKHSGDTDGQDWVSNVVGVLL